MANDTTTQTKAKRPAPVRKAPGKAIEAGELLLYNARIGNLLKSQHNMRTAASAVTTLTAFLQYSVHRWLQEAADLDHRGNSRISSQFLAEARDADAALRAAFPYDLVCLVGQGVKPIFTQKKRERKASRAGKEEEGEEEEEEVAEEEVDQEEVEAEEDAQDEADAEAARAEEEAQGETPEVQGEEEEEQQVEEEEAQSDGEEARRARKKQKKEAKKAAKKSKN